MTLPSPAPGLVLSYSYLWHHQHGAGETDGRKDRPCAIVLTAVDEEGDLRVYVAPITHSRPKDDPHAVELPPIVKRKLGLDLRPIARNRSDTFVWGFLPENIFAAVKRGIAAHQRAGRMRLTGRD